MADNELEYESEEGNPMLGFISKSVASRVREIILPFCSAPVRLHLKYSVQFWVLQYQKDTDTLEQVK